MKISVPLLYKEKAMVFEEKNMLITSRASSAIYLVLDSLKDKGNVIVPANLCYAGIYPILYAGMTPVFCDVEQHSGNTNLDFFKKAVTSKTVAAIIPHMYGNPVKELPEIAEFCKENGILLIEDCASAMGAKADYPLGKVGDYTVYSTGYSKTLDLGKICENPSIELKPKADYINYRALNKRRLDLRGAVSVKIKVSGENCQEVISDAFGMNVKVKKTPVKLAQKKLSSSKSVQLSEEIEINDSQPAIINIIKCLELKNPKMTSIFMAKMIYFL